MILLSKYNTSIGNKTLLEFKQKIVLSFKISLLLFNKKSETFLGNYCPKGRHALRDIRDQIGNVLHVTVL